MIVVDYIISKVKKAKKKGENETTYFIIIFSIYVNFSLKWYKQNS